MEKHTGPPSFAPAAAFAPPPNDGRLRQRDVAKEILEAIRLRWGLIALITIGTALTAWALASLQPNRYRASAIAAITPVAETVADQIRGVQALNQSTFVATVAALASTPAVRGAAIPATESGYSLRAVVLPSTNLLRIEVDGGRPQQARDIANRAPAILSEHARRIFQIYGVTMVSPASGGELISPRKGRAAAAGVLVGLLLGMTIAWALTRPAARSEVT